MKTAPLVGVVACLTIGCATTEYVHITPECSVPPMPAPPEITAPPACPADECLTDETWGQIVEREAALIDSLLEHRAIVRELCQ